MRSFTRYAKLKAALISIRLPGPSRRRHLRVAVKGAEPVEFGFLQRRIKILEVNVATLERDIVGRVNRPATFL